jgi:hypothetical protein
MSTYLISVLVQAAITAIIVGLTIAFLYVARRSNPAPGRVIVDLYLCQQQAQAHEAEIAYLHSLIIKQAPELYSKRAVLEARRVAIQAMINVINVQIAAQGGSSLASPVLIVSLQASVVELRRIENELDAAETLS